MLRALLLSAALLCAPLLAGQESGTWQPDSPNAEQHEDTFSGPVVALTPERITVKRNVLGKPERRTFEIKPNTRIEGKLKVKAKVTVGYISTDDGDIARLIVVRGGR